MTATKEDRIRRYINERVLFEETYGIGGARVTGSRGAQNCSIYRVDVNSYSTLIYVYDDELEMWFGRDDIMPNTYQGHWTNKFTPDAEVHQCSMDALYGMLRRGGYAKYCAARATGGR